MSIVRNILKPAFLILLMLVLVDCAGKNKNDDALDDETEEVVEGLSPEEQMELKKRKKSQSGDVGKLGKFYREKRWTELQDEATKILGARPNDLRALAALGLYHMQRNEDGAARIFFERALVKHKNVAGLYNNIGVLQLRDDNLPSAFESFRKAYGLSNGNANVVANLGSIYVKYMDYVEAEAMVEDAYNQLSSNVIVANNYAIVLRTQGQFEEAEKIYKKALAKDPRNISTNLNYAILLIDYMKNYSKARQIANKLEFLNPTDQYVAKKIQGIQRKVQAAKQ